MIADKIYEISKQERKREKLIPSQEDIQRYKEMYPLDTDHLSHLIGLTDKVTSPNPFDYDSSAQVLLELGITEKDLQILQLVHRFEDKGFKLAFVSPELEEEFLRSRKSNYEVTVTSGLAKYFHFIFTPFISKS